MNSPDVDNEVLIHAPDKYLRNGDFVNAYITHCENYDLFGEIKE